MDIDTFTTAYNARRNGFETRWRNPLTPFLHYSDGVLECAQAGAYWFIDMVGLEICKAHRKADLGWIGFIDIRVVNDTALVELRRDLGEHPVWIKHIDYTDLPAGDWQFYLYDEGDTFLLALPSEY